MNRRALRSTAAWIILFIVGCSGGGGGCGGCGGAGGCTANIPGGFPTAKRASNAITAELSGQGIQYFQNNLTALVGTLLGTTNGLSLNVPCIQQTQNVAVLGDVTVNACCSAACNVMAAINSVTITPTTAPNRSVDIQIVLSMNIDTGRIPIEVPVQIFGFGLCTIGCDMNYAAQNIPIDVTMNLNVDPAWGDILGVNIMGIDISTLIDVNNLNISSQGGICSGVACGALDIGLIKQALFSALTPTLNTTVANALDGFRCQACDTARWTAHGGCPDSSQTTGAIPVASCQNDACFIGDPAQHKCVPRELGLQGRVNAGSLLASFGGPSDALIDLYAMAGGKSTLGRPTTYVDSGGGVVLGVMGGTDSPNPAACVPHHDAPAVVIPDSIDFQAAATEAGLPHVTDYAAGIGISSPFMNKALYDAYNAGVICLNVDSSVTSFLSSAVFQGTLLPSLGVLTHGQNVPMAVALRPHEVPTILVGKGTLKDVNGMMVPDDPLLTIQMKDLQLDFYALIEERQVRLFSLTTDVSLPLSLNFDPVAGTVTPALGDISALLSNTRASNSEMLAEDPATLANLVESVIGLVQPLIGGILQPIALPTFQGLTVGISSARGAVPARTGGFQHLALFASLALSHPEVVHTETTATLAEANVPAFANIVGANHQLPYAVINAQAEGARSLSFAGYEYAYRVDNGLWSPWIRKSRFEVHSPVFLIQGKHNIETMSRVIDQPETQDATPAATEFVVDYEAPSVHFDVVDGKLLTVANDSVWKTDLQYRYSVNGGAWTSAGPAQSFDLAQLSDRASVEVEVLDGSGLSTKAHYGLNVGAISTVPVNAHKTTGGGAQGGCNQAGFPAAVGLLLAVLFLTRRRHA
jgi:hypothetical protein